VLDSLTINPSSRRISTVPASKSLVKPPADMSKGEIYNKYMAARRTQLRRRAQATTFRQDLLDSGLVFGSGVAMGAYFQLYPNMERSGATATSKGVDNKLLVGIAATLASVSTKGFVSRLTRSAGSAGLALAGADMGRELAMEKS